MSKDLAYRFLIDFQQALGCDLAAVNSFSSTVRKRASAAKIDDTAPHLRRPEEVFINHYALPRLFQELQSKLALSSENARAALLCENYRYLPAMCSGSPARAVRHPFDKTFAPDPSTVLANWSSGKANALRQSCPDLALRAPCPFSVVFEAKYFDKGSSTKAGADLVRSIYQAFFYRSLPSIDSRDQRPSWNYEFACLLACDASVDGALLAAWRQIPQAVRDGFWDGANLFVLLVRGEP